MNLYFRFAWTLLFSRFRSRVEPLGPSWTSFRVMPNDLDIFMHMNNGRYFSLFDLARVDLMLRTGLYQKIRAEGWYPVVVAESITFKRSLKLFESFDVETRILGWDDKAILIQHRIVRGDEEATRAVIRARFLRKAGGSVTSAEMARLAGYDAQSPKLDEAVERWNEDQKAAHHAVRLVPQFDTFGEQL